MKFSKYHGTGNDFIMVDQRGKEKGPDRLTRADQVLIEKLCDRRFGIGGDGLILLQDCPGFDFEMVYFNADGRESSMCGNGGRCLAAFAHALGIFEKRCRFSAVDGAHEAVVSGAGEIVDGANLGGPVWVELKMSDVQTIDNQGDSFILDTGSPHFVLFEKTLGGLDVFQKGRQIRNSAPFRANGINVNFVEETGPHSVRVATYERGVEDETYSCGTGAAAAAMAFFLKNKLAGPQEIAVATKGGGLAVRFAPDGRGGFENTWLCGPATAVFSGEIKLR